MDGTRSLSAFAAAYGFHRSRIDRAISNGDFEQIDVDPGKTREWTFQDAMRAACYIRCLDVDLPTKVGRSLTRLRLHGFQDEKAFVVVEHFPWNVHTSKGDAGHPFLAHVVKAAEIAESFDRKGVKPLAIHVIDLGDIEQKVTRAWKQAARLED